jgi:S-adenosylmethionine hydrolase
MSGPIVFVSDLGLRDEFVGVCHLVIARAAPAVHVIDLSHGIPPHDVENGALVLREGMAYAPLDAVGLAVVDPGSGTDRLAIAVSTVAGPRLVGPDNGLLSLAWSALGGVTAAVVIDPDAIGATRVSEVFHGRDIFAPAAALLADGAPLESLGSPVPLSTLMTLTMVEPEITPGRIAAYVLEVDRFGNLRLNVRPGDLDAAGFTLGSTVEVASASASVRARRVVLYSDVGSGDYGLLADAWDWASVIRFEANASAGLGAGRGDPVWIATAD